MLNTFLIQKLQKTYQDQFVPGIFKLSLYCQGSFTTDLTYTGLFFKQLQPSPFQQHYTGCFKNVDPIAEM